MKSTRLELNRLRLLSSFFQYAIALSDMNKMGMSGNSLDNAKATDVPERSGKSISIMSRESRPHHLPIWMAFRPVAASRIEQSWNRSKVVILCDVAGSSRISIFSTGTALGISFERDLFVTPIERHRN